MHFFSAHEISAHCEILDALQDLADNVIGERTMKIRVARACDMFAPRCPACADVLSRKLQVGLTDWSCKACGWACKEAA
jgi:hypothetical protein